MILNNFKDWWYGTVNSYTYSGRGAVSYKNIEGTTVNLRYDEVNNFLSTPYGSLSDIDGNSGFHCLVLGTNNTPVTVDDCEWKNNITDLSTVSLSFSRATVNGNRVIRATKSVANNTENDITVSEVGWVVRDYSGQKILIAREVLATPVVVKANGGVQIFGIDIG